MRQGEKMLPLPITELDVQALVDSDLSWEEEKQVWRGIESDPALKAYYKRIISQKKLLISWWRSDTIEEDDRDTSIH